MIECILATSTLTLNTTQGMLIKKQSDSSQSSVNFFIRGQKRYPNAPGGLAQIWLIVQSI